MRPGIPGYRNSRPRRGRGPLRGPVIPPDDRTMGIPTLTSGVPPVTIEAKVLKLQGVLLIGAGALQSTAPDLPWHTRSGRETT